ncbi:gustatory and pheromone receptor 32a-like [Vespula squamosa]|uniref:Gustatory and pheromone receptor 32a-like n=1 Tax=Vespula squamosa TaxID=30214 RepID=A0ABD2AXZ7_VESSQ
MLTTTIDSPQHKRIRRMWNNRKNDSPSFDIHQTEVHLELIKCARNINDAYGLHILMSVPTAFLFIITVAYNMYYALMTENNFLEPLIFFIFLYWIFYFCLKIIMLSHVCARTITEIHNFILQLIQNPLTFTCYGFFDLNYTLMRKMIGIIVTYLIILIQIEKVSV